jgi:arylsulfatase A-like enzyme
MPRRAAARLISVTRRRAGFAACAAFLTSFVGAPARNATAAADNSPAGAERPNIIFILADDLGYGDLGCYGQERIKTPRLDRMASEGLRFTQGYAGAAVCAPSRCVLMTGRHGGHVRVRGNKEASQPGAALAAGDATVARVLQDAGYATALVGKWGLGEPTKNRAGLPRRQGFDQFFGYLRHGHAHNYYPDFLWRNESKERLPNVLSAAPAHRERVAVKKVQYSHDLLAEEGLKFVRDHQDGPFFLFWALTIPHANDEAGDRGMEVPDYGEYADLDWPEPQKGHAAMISRMDRDVGRMLDLLKELGIARRTLVLFASDNGPHREGGNDPDFNDSNGPLRGYKGSVTEGGIRVPLVAWQPAAVPAGTTSDATVTFADILPTFAAIAGAAPPTGVDGMDFSPTLHGERQPELSDRYLYWEWNRNGLRQQAARRGPWKVVRDPIAHKTELFDLDADVGESHDLAAEHPEIAARFEQFLRNARIDDPNWPVARAVAPRSPDIRYGAR